MDHLIRRLSRDVAEMRVGRGPRRAQLRELLAAVDPELRRVRNLECTRLAGAKVRLARLDSRQDSTLLETAVEESGRRLALLDKQIVEAIAAQLRRPRSP